ncbi:hypothetical protein [Myxacorys almedinensis]|nr:hypothetical protein [Myxacorys almedinensis]
MPKMNMIARPSTPPSAMYSANSSFTVAESPSLALTSPPENLSLFAQLRKHYPAGALVSELLQVHEGQFVVRVLVQDGTATLASAIAAASRVEDAEDRARVRAMAVLGISLVGGAMPMPLMSPSFEAHSLMPDSLPSDPLKEQGAPAPLTPSMLPEPDQERVEQQTVQQVEQVEPAKKTSRKQEEAPSEDTLLSFSDLDSANASPEPVEVEYSEGESLFEEAEEPMKAIVPDLSNEPIDLSDAIAQIGTEIERIGWTKKQGSTYLQQTYSKKTRAELTEDELLEFLHYLKALPSKGHPSLSQLPF